MLDRCGDRHAELYARAARDHLADCLVTLPTLLRHDARAAIHLWFANLEGMRRALFPQLPEAYAAWRRGDGGRALRATAAAGAEHWMRTCTALLAGEATPASPEAGGAGPAPDPAARR
jgi:hypothetical protein